MDQEEPGLGRILDPHKNRKIIITFADVLSCTVDTGSEDFSFPGFNVFIFLLGTGDTSFFTSILRDLLVPTRPTHNQRFN